MVSQKTSSLLWMQTKSINLEAASAAGWAIRNTNSYSILSLDSLMDARYLQSSNDTAMSPGIKSQIN